MKFVTLIYFLALTVSITACQQTSRLGNPKFKPDNWVTVKSTDWQVALLPERNRTDLEVMKTRLIAERQGQYFNLFGKFRPDTLEFIQTTTHSLDQAYLNLRYSNAAILENLTPEMRGLSLNYQEYEAEVGVTNNANTRMIDDDWRRILILDHASSLSPFAVPN